MLIEKIALALIFFILPLQYLHAFKNELMEVCYKESVSGVPDRCRYLVNEELSVEQSDKICKRARPLVLAGYEDLIRKVMVDAIIKGLDKELAKNWKNKLNEDERNNIETATNKAIGLMFAANDANQTTIDQFWGVAYKQQRSIIIVLHSIGLVLANLYHLRH